MVLVPGIFMITVDSNVLTIIRESRPIRNNFDMVDQHLAGTGNIEILVDTGIEDGLKDPVVLNAMADLQETLEFRYPGIVRKPSPLSTSPGMPFRC